MYISKFLCDAGGGGGTAVLSHCLLLYMERSQSGGFLMFAQSNEEMAMQSECLQASVYLPNSRNPVGELLCGHEIMGAERHLPFQIHLGQHELASQREPSSNSAIA